MTDEPRPPGDDEPTPHDPQEPTEAEAEADDTDPDDTGTGTDAAAGERTRRRLPSLTTLAAGLLVLALVGLVTVLGVDVARTAAESGRREAALAGARQMAVNFTSLSSENIDEDISNIVTLATGSFQQEYSSQADTIRSLVADQGLASTGSVITAGLQTFDDDSAVALLAVDSVVTTTERPEGDTVRYRMQIDLVRVDGRWLSEKVQFVL